MKFVCAAAIGLSLLSSAALAGAPEGTWLSEDGGTKVRLANCGGKLCGTVVWLNQPIDAATGKPKTDKLNPDPAKRARPLLGLQVVNGLAASGPDKWSGNDLQRRRRQHLPGQHEGAGRAHRQGGRLRAEGAVQGPHLDAQQLSARLNL